MKRNKNKEMEEKEPLEQEIPEEQDAVEDTEEVENASEEPADTEEVPVQEKGSAFEELQNKYLRLVAEFDNYRKRTARERIELIQTSEKEVVVSLLDILDDAERAEEQMEQTDEASVVREGALLIFNKLRKALKARGLKEMDSQHADFDAELHDAIAEIPAPSEELQGKVVDSVQKGYYLNDKIIRHAKVVVGK